MKKSMNKIRLFLLHLLLDTGLLVTTRYLFHVYTDIAKRRSMWGILKEYFVSGLS